MNYQDISDRSIDLAVFQTIFGKDVFTKDADLRRAWERGVSYCNSWDDAGPIIQEFLISITPRCANGEWKASIYLGREDIFDEYASSWDKNPLRAAMIAFLMMKGGDKNEI